MSPEEFENRMMDALAESMTPEDAAEVYVSLTREHMDDDRRFRRSKDLQMPKENFLRLMGQAFAAGYTYNRLSTERSER